MAMTFTELDGLIKEKKKYSSLQRSLKYNEPLTISLKSKARVSKVITAFKSGEEISQLAFEIYVCGTAKQPYTGLESESRVYFEDIVRKIFQKDLIINDDYFLKPNKKYHFYSKSNPQFRKVRVFKGNYKCDSTGGYGYRLDLFIK